MSASVIEFVHALFMVVWIASLPLLFWHRWPTLSLIAAIYTVTFVVVNRVSHWILGECIFTRAARWAGGAWDNELFAVKFSRTVFGLIPTNRQVTYVEQALIIVAALGAITTLWWKHR